MNVLESADREGTLGKSAEFPVQAWAGNGAAGNTCGTVRGNITAGALSAYRVLPVLRKENCR